MKKGRFTEWQQEYWDETYLDNNPFMPAIRCPECKEVPAKQRSYPDNKLPAGVGTYTEFKCASGHIWREHCIND